MRLLHAVLFAAAAVTLAPAVPSVARVQLLPSPTPSPGQPTAPPIPPPQPAPEDPAVRKLAIAQFVAWQSGTVDTSRYAGALASQLDQQTIDNASATLGRAGALQKATFLGISQMNGQKLYIYRMACANGTVQMDFGIDKASGKITVIFFE